MKLFEHQNNMFCIDLFICILFICVLYFKSDDVQPCNFSLRQELHNFEALKHTAFFADCHNYVGSGTSASVISLLVPDEKA